MSQRFSKPDVIVVSDEQLRGTPYRACYVTIGVSSLNDQDMERALSAIAGVISNPRVAVTYQGEKSLLDKDKVTTLRVTYYGKEVMSTDIADALKSVL